MQPTLTPILPCLPRHRLMPVRLGPLRRVSCPRRRDLRISYQKGAATAYIRPLSTRGRHWLWDHVKYPYTGSNAMVEAEHLLTLIQGMDAQGLASYWQLSVVFGSHS
jgi:hypothetical protein